MFPMQDDESLRRWKEQLLGSIVLDPVEGINYIIVCYFLENLPCK